MIQGLRAAMRCSTRGAVRNIAMVRNHSLSKGTTVNGCFDTQVFDLCVFISHRWIQKRWSVLHFALRYLVCPQRFVCRKSSRAEDPRHVSFALEVGDTEAKSNATEAQLSLFFYFFMCQGEESCCIRSRLAERGPSCQATIQRPHWQTAANEAGAAGRGRNAAEKGNATFFCNRSLGHMHTHIKKRHTVYWGGFGAANHSLAYFGKCKDTDGTTSANMTTTVRSVDCRTWVTTRSHIQILRPSERPTQSAQTRSRGQIFLFYLRTPRFVTLLASCNVSVHVCSGTVRVILPATLWHFTYGIGHFFVFLLYVSIKLLKNIYFS